MVRFIDCDECGFRGEADEYNDESVTNCPGCGTRLNE